MSREFKLPDLGEGIAEAQVIKVLISEGDEVSEDQGLMEVETDKAAVEIPSPYAGVASKVHVKDGETINVGDVIVTFDGADGGNGQASETKKDDNKDEKQEGKKEEKETRKGRKKDEDQDRAEEGEEDADEKPRRRKEPERAERRPAKDEGDRGASRRTSAPAAPAVRKLAREKGVDIDDIDGSGPGGRVTREDVEQAASGGRDDEDRAESRDSKPARSADRMPAERFRRATPPPGVSDEDKWGAIRKSPLTQIRKTIAKQMSRSVSTIPHVTHGDEADITDLEVMRKQLSEATGGDPKFTAMTFALRAVCVAIKNHPIFNASFDEENEQIIYKEYVNLGIAVDTERGLIVPVIRNADQLSLLGLAEQLGDIAMRIRQNKFAIEDLRGGTFTITNVGALGGTFSTPIINYPEVAILGLGRSRQVPRIEGDEIVAATMLPINLSFDHRATDGAAAARFTREVIGYLETPAKLLLH